MRRFEEFQIWFDRHADERTKEWVFAKAGSKDYRCIYRMFSSMKYANDGSYEDKPFSLRDASLFRFFPQIHGFFHFDCIESRYLTDYKLSGPDPIEKGLDALDLLIHIRELSLNTTSEGMERLQALPHITHLKVKCQDLNNGNWLSGWGGLTELCISGITNFSRVEGNQSLKRLILSGPCEDLSGVAAYENLVSLSIDGAKLNQSLDLSQCTWLESVHIRNSNLSAIRLVLPPLVDLELKDCDLQNFDLRCPSIEHLVISRCQGQSLDWLNGIVIINSIVLDALDVESIDQIRSKNLTCVEICRSKIKRSPDLSSESNLIKISYTGAAIETVDFERLPVGIKSLVVRGASLKTISGNAPEGMERLNLKGCGLESVKWINWRTYTTQSCS